LLRLILALVAIALTALSAVAAERVKLPTEMLGTWCLDEHEASTYRRGDCQDKTDSWLQIGADGYQGHEFGCKAIKVSVDRRNPRYTVYELESRCEGEAKTWTAAINMWLGLNDTLVIVEAPRGRR
jgi:hypothetical protein